MHIFLLGLISHQLIWGGGGKSDCGLAVEQEQTAPFRLHTFPACLPDSAWAASGKPRGK